MLLDTYFFKLASQEKGDKTKPLVSASSRFYAESKKDLRHKKYFPQMTFNYDNWDGNKGASFEYSPPPFRRVTTMLDEYFDNIFEKKANHRFVNRNYPTIQAI